MGWRKGATGRGEELPELGRLGSGGGRSSHGGWGPGTPESPRVCPLRNGELVSGCHPHSWVQPGLECNKTQAGGPVSPGGHRQEPRTARGDRHGEMPRRDTMAETAYVSPYVLVGSVSILHVVTTGVLRRRLRSLVL